MVHFINLIFISSIKFPGFFRKNAVFRSHHGDGILCPVNLKGNVVWLALQKQIKRNRFEKNNFLKSWQPFSCSEFCFVTRFYTCISFTVVGNSLKTYRLWFIMSFQKWKCWWIQIVYTIILKLMQFTRHPVLSLFNITNLQKLYFHFFLFSSFSKE